MRMSKVLAVVFVVSFVLCAVPAQAVLVGPSNVVLPASPGGLLSFDLVVLDPMGVSAAAFQATITVSGPGGLAFDEAGSLVVDADPGYWIFGNSVGAAAIARGSNSYEFGDSPNDPATEALSVGDIMARYAFTWDGTPVQEYLFCLDLNTTRSFILNALSFETQALQFSPGEFEGTDSSFKIPIPEPTTLLLIGLGTLFLRRKRR
ncbi:MAG: PEP-CTERM sorting domain-containing protein [Chloroflexota bacterium]|nr:MAG: PEP-CTERM sorting domain-containing protein [Chloroflexota bacterium]